MKAAILTLAVAIAIAGPAYATTNAVLVKDPTARRAVKALQKQVRGLNIRVASLERGAACETSAFGISSYLGYVYTPDSGGTFFYTTGLDQTPAGQTPGVWLSIVDPTCVSSLSGQTQSQRGRVPERLTPRSK